MSDGVIEESSNKKVSGEHKGLRSGKYLLCLYF
ncbi:hypothetical protein ACP_3062 [Acidobacterium capsulatum ATCC 51196]|uniref:Uncharacterized protein n=1 Tax=Acidobacterium capsulatum (strain ATCC 51196 / DSM 11244 / BCRC 80197 / JCM 7670 / NBRC 15755 / NCIMB 13165 / 161) TaxID=240015 RepID=C1F4L9_ACIC5|nr:hypothetical protein ACP_3062 [Acidobacterium capsulatum ATCC 51196]